MSELTFTKAGARAISRRMVDRSAYRRNLVRRTALGVYIISCIAISSSLLSESDDVWLGGAMSVVAWLLFGLFLRSLHRTDRRFLPSAFYTVFYVAGMLVSATVINSGAYMFEVGEFGTANGTLWIALLLGTLAIHFQFIGFARAIESAGLIRDRLSDSKSLSFLFVWLTLLVSAAIIVMYGTPGAAGVNRILYWGNIAPAFLSPVRIAITLSIFVAAFWAFKRRSILAVIMVALIYVYLAVVFLGEKFSIFVQFAFFVGIVVGALASARQIVRFYKLAIVSGVIMFAGVALHYELQGLGLNFVFDRLAVQAQVLWSVMNEGGDTLIHGFLGDCAPNCEKVLDPRDLVAERYIPSVLYEQRKELGTTLSGYNPAVLILYFGLFFAVLAQAAIGLILGILQAKVVRATASGTMFYGFLLAVGYYFATMMWFVANQSLAVPLAGVLVISGIYALTLIRHRKPE